MATITTAEFLDGVARTAGEAMAINGGKLTVRTDTRFHANSPASMTGTIGAVTISATLGGSWILDGRNVRWMPYNTGTGNVPAIGTSITRGGATGVLLGVWASITTAPTAVGAAMPATGFIKFREVTGGAFTAGALAGIGASATGPDVVGWIEVVQDQNVTNTIPRLGDFTVRGNWFSLGTTTGAANQVVNIPTNGSATNYVPGIWIANKASPTTDDDYDFYPSIYAAAMIAGNLGTDARSKFVLMGTNGTVTIGHNGTVAVGYVPPAGRAIRIPNVIGRQATAAARATSVIPSATAATRVDFLTTGAGYIDVEYFLTDWYFLLAQPFYVKLNHVASFDYFNISECASALDIYDGGNGISQSIDARTMTLTSNFAGGRFEKWCSHRAAAGTTDHAWEALYCSGLVVSNCDSGIVTFVRSTGVAYNIVQCSGMTFNNCREYNQGIQFTTCFDCTVNDLDHCDRYVGAATTAGVYVATIAASCDNIVFDGMTFGLGGTIANQHPYTGLFSVTLSKNCKFRNIGTRAAPLNGGSANQVGVIFASGGNNQNLRFQRIYVVPTRTAAWTTVNSDKGNLYEHVSGDITDTFINADLNARVRACGGVFTTTAQVSVYGTHFMDSFSSDTTSRVFLTMNEPTAETAHIVNVVSGTPKFTSSQGLVVAAVGDEIIFEQDYFMLGCTALTTSVPIVLGTNVTYSSGARWGNHDIYYQIDKNDGNGWNGTWKNLTGTLWGAETSISPSLGFKIKLRIVCATAAVDNLITYIRMEMTSSAAAQAANLYPLDTNTVTFNGLPTGCDVVVLTAGTSTILEQKDAWASSSYGFTFAGAQTIDIGFLKPGYVPYYIRNLALTAVDSSIPVTLTPDRNYV